MKYYADNIKEGLNKDGIPFRDVSEFIYLRTGRLFLLKYSKKLDRAAIDLINEYVELRKYNPAVLAKMRETHKGAMNLFNRNYDEFMLETENRKKKEAWEKARREEALERKRARERAKEEAKRKMEEAKKIKEDALAELESFISLKEDRTEEEMQNFKKMKNEAVDFLIEKGVDPSIIDSWIKDGKIDVGDLDSVKAQYNRMIEIIEKIGDNVGLEQAIDLIEMVKSTQPDAQEEAIREFIWSNIDLYTEEDFESMISHVYNKSFKFSITRSHDRQYKSGLKTRVKSHIKILFKDELEKVH